MSEPTPVVTVQKPRFPKLRARLRRIARSPYTPVVAAATAGGAAAYAGTNKALRDSVKETVSEAVDSVSDMLETATES